MSEAFVYMWYDSENSMYYIGYHKGTPDDGYTHSSSIMESFKIAPKGFRRRILAYGTRDEMVQLESDLLKNRKERCWDKYYNVITQFPPPTLYGKDSPNWKHGLYRNTEHLAMYGKKYYEENREKVREKHKKYYEENREKVREKRKKYYEENREKDNEKSKKYRQENREKTNEYSKKYYEENREKALDKRKEYRQKNREKIAEYKRKYREEKKKQQKECTFIPVDQY
jgi:flagellar biosynthesis GTPase FlhF